MGKAGGSRVGVIGGGPDGLMAAEYLATHGIQVTVFDAMPSVGRKFLLAGRGGLNLTHSEHIDAFIPRYGARETELAPLIEAFGPDQLRAWTDALGINTFVGSSGRVFPAEMKAAPLLRAWLARLRASGVQFCVRHRWLGWDDSDTTGHTMRFSTADGERSFNADATVLALGGGSWAKLGSDGKWVAPLRARGIDIAALRPANCGFDLATDGTG